MPQFTTQTQPNGAFSMLGMAGALPEFSNSRPPPVMQQGPQRQPSSHPAMNPNYNPQQTPQYAGQPSATSPNYPQMPMQYQTSYQHAAQPYAQAQPNQQPHLMGPNPGQGGLMGGTYYPSAQSQAFSYYPGQYMAAGQLQNSLPGRQGMYGAPYGRASGQAFGQGGSMERNWPF